MMHTVTPSGKPIKPTGNRNYDYHLGELQVALDPSHPKHILPEVRPADVVLDVGCGAGQTLIVCCPGRPSYGMDVDFEALRFGRTLTSDVVFACGSAEKLPYASSSFDLVVSRVALLYTHLPTSLAEIHRVLKPGGRAWITLDTIQRGWRLTRRVGTWKAWIRFGYVICNSLTFHFTGCLFRLPGQPIESFQTPWRVRRTLRKLGFENISITRTVHFLVTASKPSEG